MLRPPHSPQISEVNNLHYLDFLRSLLHSRWRASLGAFSCSRPRPPPALRRARRHRARRARPWGTRRQGAGEHRGRRRRACAALSASQQHTNPHSFLPLSGLKELLQRPRPRLGRLGARTFLGLHVTSRQGGAAWMQLGVAYHPALVLRVGVSIRRLGPCALRDAARGIPRSSGQKGS